MVNASVLAEPHTRECCYAVTEGWTKKFLTRCAIDGRIPAFRAATALFYDLSNVMQAGKG